MDMGLILNLQSIRRSTYLAELTPNFRKPTRVGFSPTIFSFSTLNTLHWKSFIKKDNYQKKEADMALLLWITLYLFLVVWMLIENVWMTCISSEYQKWNGIKFSCPAKIKTWELMISNHDPIWVSLSVITNCIYLVDVTFDKKEFMMIITFIIR